MSSAASRAIGELSDEDRQRLTDAHRELRDAATRYDRFVSSSPLDPGDVVPVHSAAEMSEAQDAVDRAEQHLWELRAELLGWTRPAWAPDAASQTDWFSEEDRLYDELPDPE